MNLQSERSRDWDSLIFRPDHTETPTIVPVSDAPTRHYHCPRAYDSVAFYDRLVEPFNSDHMLGSAALWPM
jgi:hypothetical protein